MNIGNNPSSSNNKARPFFNNIFNIALGRKANTCDNQKSQINSHFNSLQQQGYAEIEIPKKLKKDIAKLNQIFDDVKNKKNEEKSILGNDIMLDLVLFSSYSASFLSGAEKKFVSDVQQQMVDFTKNIADKIFASKNFKVSFGEEPHILVRTLDPFDREAFHKDHRIVSGNTNPVEITIIYPFSNGKGTDFIPISKKNKYPETIISRYKSGAYFYDEIPDKEDIKSADPSKILMFLCRQASETLGDDFDNKSLIHAVPEEEEDVRIFFLARLSLEKK